MNIQEKENLYLLAKTKYYEGEPILSDFEFDNLEDELKMENSQVIKIVGSQDLKDIKFNHVSPMLSLNKIQVQRNESIDIANTKYRTWLTANQNNTSLQMEATPKFDGSSCNLIYENGKLDRKSVV
jgi:NAD-dependent DNA ligase